MNNNILTGTHINTRPHHAMPAGGARAKRTLMPLALLLCALSSAAPAAVASQTDAEQIVKNQPCKAGETVEQWMDHSLKPSHRDLGWRVFALDNGYDVERAFMVSKSMELHYRWRVDGSGAMQAVSGRAQQLCS
ncbi:MAG: hypothetical protein EPN21_08365 [Methylococcaceae bacterium]|nr:MAG: hypothetical protein EPN21_08365 [Methylococcaceae bacterium]